MPDKYEPGSHNAIGIIGLSQGVKWVLEQTVEKLAANEMDLVAHVPRWDGQRRRAPLTSVPAA